MSDFVQENPVGPTEDDLLTNLFQEAIVGIMGMSPQLVRPLWQRIPPTQPTAEQDWCAVGITSRSPIDFVYLTPDTDLTLQMQRHEYLHLLVAFYGPNADGLAGRLRDGLAIPNNWWFLNNYGIRAYETEETILVPFNVNQQYIGRVDLPWTVVRQLNRQYPIPTLLQSAGTVVTEQAGSANWLTPIP